MSHDSLNGFIEELDRLLKAAWGDNWGTLHEGLPTTNESESLKMPVIVVVLIERIPSEQIPNIKPRPMGTVVDPTRIGLIDQYRMHYDVTLEFRCYHNTHASAKELAEGLEELLLMFAGYFKEKGIIEEILFLRESEPSVEDGRRLDFPCRHLRYKIRVGKTIKVPQSIIRQIETQLNVRENPA